MHVISINIHACKAVLTPSSGPSFMKDGVVLTVLCLPFLTTCSDDSKPYMILKALDESYKNHIGFGIIRAGGEEPVAADVHPCSCDPFEISA